MQNVASHVKAMTDKQSLSLVGKFVSGFDELTGQDIAGVAAALFYDESGEAFLKVGDGAVAVSKVKIVGEPAFFVPLPSAAKHNQVQPSQKNDPAVDEKGAVKEPNPKESIPENQSQTNPVESRINETNREQLKTPESKENDQIRPSGEVREDEIKKENVNKEKVSFFEFTREKEESYFSF